MSYRVNRVEFDDLEQVVRIFKARGLDQAGVLGLFSDESNRRYIIDAFDALPPFTVAEALRLVNAEQRMAALAAFEPEAIVTHMNAKSLDRQTLRKKRIRWDRDLSPRVVDYEDTYELLTYRIKDRIGWDTLDVYVVKCTCPSTNRQYYLYVPEDVAKHQDAIAAVAWTMRFRGRPLTKQEYVDFMYSET